MKIFAFAASNAKDSINGKLVQFASSQFDQASVEIANLNHYEMPLFSTDREKENGIPELALAFAKKIDEADLLLISFAEHNGTYTVAFKNIFDWISRISGRKAFGDKAIFAMATSGGPRGGKGVLETATKRFPFNGGTIIAEFSLPKFNDNFSLENGITNTDLREEFNQQIEIIHQYFAAQNL
jgi:chromate reductase